jgi:hypothetical protein
VFLPLLLHPVFLLLLPLQLRKTPMHLTLS